MCVKLFNQFLQLCTDRKTAKLPRTMFAICVASMIYHMTASSIYEQAPAAVLQTLRRPQGHNVSNRVLKPSRK